MMEKRFDFLFRFFPTSFSLILNIFLVNFLFSQLGLIAGWNKHELLLLMGTYYVVWGLFFGMFIQNLSRINKYVNTGELDLLLMKPVNSQFFSSFRITIDFGEAATLITGIYLVISSLGSLNITVSLIQIIIYTALILNALVLAYSLWFMIMTLSFWIGRITNLHEVFLSLYNFNKYPIDIYQGLLKTVFIFVLPIAVMVTFPTQFLLGLLSWQFIFWSFLAGVIAIVSSHFLWQLGLRNYTSASS